MLFQSTACGIDSKFQHHKLSIPINPDRHTTTGSVTVGKPIGMLVDGTFLFAAHNGSSDVKSDSHDRTERNGNCTRHVDRYGRKFLQRYSLVSFEKLRGHCAARKRMGPQH